jgi:hypothetical protein
MYELTTDLLTIQVLDPIADQVKLGSRYCAGGYVWQVLHRDAGPLFAGPQYPNETNTFDGQGMPDAFEVAPGDAETAIGEDFLVPGVGLVRRDTVEPFDARNNPHVSAWTPWEVAQTPGRLTFTTRQAHRAWDFALTRTLEVEGGTLCVAGRIDNAGAPLPVRWFAHPFFPWTEDRRFCRFNTPATLPLNPAFRVDTEGWVTADPDFDWAVGSKQWLEGLPWGEALTAEELHPTSGIARVTCDFPVASLPIWANARTFSWEPYLDAVVGTGKTLEWGMTYAW